MRPLPRTPPIKRAPRMRSLGRQRIDAAAELLRLEYEKARLAALRTRLAGGLGRAEQSFEAAERRVAFVLDLLTNQAPRVAAAEAGAAQTPEQRIALALALLGGQPGASR